MCEFVCDCACLASIPHHIIYSGRICASFIKNHLFRFALAVLSAVQMVWLVMVVFVYFNESKRCASVAVFHNLSHFVCVCVCGRWWRADYCCALRPKNHCWERCFAFGFEYDVRLVNSEKLLCMHVWPWINRRERDRLCDMVENGNIDKRRKKVYDDSQSEMP